MAACLRAQRPGQAGQVPKSSPQDDFSRSFEAAFARLQVVVEEAYVSRVAWPEQVAAAIRAGFEFAAADPEAANLLTNRALAHGRDGIARYHRLIDYSAGLLVPGRELSPEGALLPEILETAVASGIATLVAQRVDQGRASELPTLVPDAVQFALTPYLGSEGARQLAIEVQG
jgi:hypothetical protein